MAKVSVDAFGLLQQEVVCPKAEALARIPAKSKMVEGLNMLN